MADKEKKKNWFARHKFLTAIGIIILLAIVISSSGSKNEKTTDSSNSKADTTKTDSIAKIGTAVRDGKFEFAVTSFKCGETSVGTNPYLTKTAQGQFCMLAVTVKNIGTEKQSLFSSNQKLYLGDVEYSADDSATMYAAPDNSTWYSDINPGNSVGGTIVFDVPKGVTPTISELHDSVFSGGVKVNLQ